MIARSERGRKILERFLPLYQQSRVEIRLSRPVEIEQIACQMGLPGKAAAFFWHGHGKRIIYLEKSQLLGITVPLLVHEIIHSIDDRFLDPQKDKTIRHRILEARAREMLKQMSKNFSLPPDAILGKHCSPSQLSLLRELQCEKLKHQQFQLLRAEKIAYDIQYKVTEELMRQDPAYRDFLRAWELKKGYIFTRPVTSEEINFNYS